MLKTIFIFFLLAFSTAQAATKYVHSDSTYKNLVQAWRGSATNDTIRVMEDGNEPTSDNYETLGWTRNNVVTFMHGHTRTIPDSTGISASDIWMLIGHDGWQIHGQGGGFVTARRLLYLYGADDFEMHDVDIQISLADCSGIDNSTAGYALISSGKATSHDPDGWIIDNVDFSAPNRTSGDAAAFYSSALASSSLSNIRMGNGIIQGFILSLDVTISSDVEFSDITMTDVGKPFYFYDNTGKGASNVTFDNVDWTGATTYSQIARIDGLSITDCSFGGEGVYLKNTGDITFTGNSIDGGNTSGYGFYCSSDSTASDGAVITGNTIKGVERCILFTPNGTGYRGLNGVVIANNVLGNPVSPDSMSKAIETGGAYNAQIYNNTIYGSLDNDQHGIVIGHDNGGDVQDLSGNHHATSIDCYGNSFVDWSHQTELSNVMPIVVKADSAKIYNNTWSGDLSSATSYNGNAIYFKGARYAYVYNNDMMNLSGVSGFRFGTSDAYDAADNYIYNNVFGDDLDAAIVLQNTVAAQSGVAAVDNNAMLCATLATNENGTTEYGIADSSWYGSANFTDASSWRMSFGGKAGLTGVTAMPSGFVTVGAIQRSTDPVIGLNQNGFETPVRAFLRCRDMGLTGVTLDWYIHGSGAADALNMDNWLHGAGATGDGTASGSTWEAQAFDTLRVGRVR